MIGFPLLLIPLAIYNIIVFLMRDVSFAAPLFTVPLMSGAGWPVTLSDVLLTLGILLLLFEVIKGARPGAKYLTDHLLSLLVFGGAAAEFVLLPQFGTSTFFLLTLLALVDFLSGIALRARRGAQAASSARGCAKAEAARARPRYGPVPEPRVRAGAAPAPSPCRQPRRPRNRVRRIAPRTDARAIPRSRRHRLRRRRRCRRPGLQPGDGSPPSPDTAALTPQGSDDLPGPDAGGAGLALVGAVSGLRIGGGCPPQAAGLRGMLGGREQMGDKGRGGPRRLAGRSCVHSVGCDHRHQRDAGRPGVGNAAVIYRLLWSTAA